jgi:ribonuclease VapC
MADVPIYVLDAFALMAYLKGEVSAQRVRDLLTNAESGKCKIHMSVINLGEVLYNLERNNGLNKAHEALTIIQSLPIEVLPAENQLVFAAAHIKANYPVSYADAFAIASAQQMGGAVVTGDPEFSDVADLVRVEWLAQGG